MKRFEYMKNTIELRFKQNNVLMQNLDNALWCQWLNSMVQLNKKKYTQNIKIIWVSLAFLIITQYKNITPYGNENHYLKCPSHQVHNRPKKKLYDQCKETSCFGTLLLAWFNLNPSMDKQLHPLWSVVWNYI